MSRRTHYQTKESIEERITHFIRKRDSSLETADRFDAAANWYSQMACNSDGSVNHGMIEKFNRCRDDAMKLRSLADHEDRVTLPKLKAKLAEFNTTPLPGIGETQVAKR